jgi:single-strand DNA-binding protein
MTNTVVLIVRLTRDPEMHYTTDGTPVASFTVAVDRNFKNKAGEYEADFITCQAWRKLGETVGNHLTKGRLVSVRGQIRTRNYEAQDGSKRYVTEVVCDGMDFLDKPKSKDTGAGVPDSDSEELPDDLPF